MFSPIWTDLVHHPLCFCAHINTPNSYLFRNRWEFALGSLCPAHYQNRHESASWSLPGIPYGSRVLLSESYSLLDVMVNWAELTGDAGYLTSLILLQGFSKWYAHVFCGNRKSLCLCLLGQSSCVFVSIVWYGWTKHYLHNLNTMTLTVF